MRTAGGVHLYTLCIGSDECELLRHWVHMHKLTWRLLKHWVPIFNMILCENGYKLQWQSLKHWVLINNASFRVHRHELKWCLLKHWVLIINASFRVHRHELKWCLLNIEFWKSSWAWKILLLKHLCKFMRLKWRLQTLSVYEHYEHVYA